MAQYIVYKSTDTSAPVMTGAVDTLCALLYACLVTGYGSKAAAGWTREFDGTNKSVFRPSAGTRFYLRVLDDGSLTGGARDACIRGYETMSDVDTGNNPFPTVAQRSDTNNTVRKSVTADGTARPWTLIADGKTVVCWIATGDSGTSSLSFYFGDFSSFVSNDIYNCICIALGASTAGAVGNPTGGVENICVSFTATTAVQSNHYIARKSIGTGGSEQSTKWAPVVKAPGGDNLGHSPNGSLVYPNTADAKLWMSRIYLLDTTNGTLRGYLRGIYAVNHTVGNFTEGDTFSGVGSLATRTFTFSPKGTSQQGGGSSTIVAYETSNTLDT